MRIGLGYDSHRFDPARTLVLGGVTIPDHPGLSGHSDGDAVAHAVIDALLGAAGLGDVGTLFPDDDPAYEDADSLELLGRVVRRLGRENFQVVNVDVVVATETPRISEHAAAMSRALAARIDIVDAAVSVKGKSNEGMGWIGRGEGMAVWAVALVDRIGGWDRLHATLNGG